MSRRFAWVYHATTRAFFEFGCPGCHGVIGEDEEVIWLELPPARGIWPCCRKCWDTHPENPAGVPKRECPN